MEPVLLCVLQMVVSKVAINKIPPFLQFNLAYQKFWVLFPHWRVNVFSGKHK